MDRYKLNQTTKHQFSINYAYHIWYIANTRIWYILYLNSIWTLRILASHRVQINIVTFHLNIKASKESRIGQKQSLTNTKHHLIYTEQCITNIQSIWCKKKKKKKLTEWKKNHRSFCISKVPHTKAKKESNQPKFLKVTQTHYHQRSNKQYQTGLKIETLVIKREKKKEKRKGVMNERAIKLTNLPYLQKYAIMDELPTATRE